MIRDIEFDLNDPHPSPQDKWVGSYAIVINISKILKKIKALNYRKWIIRLISGEPGLSIITEDYGKEIRMDVFIDFSAITICTEIGSIASLYQMIFAGLEHVFKSKNWDTAVIHQIHSEIKEEKYKVSGIYGRSFLSPDKKYKAQLYCELFSDYFDLYVEFIGKKENKKIFFLKSNDVDPYKFFGFFTVYYWRDNEHFIISDFNKEIFYIYNIHSLDFSIEYRPIHNTLEELQNYVKAFQYGVSYEESLKLLGLRKY